MTIHRVSEVHKKWHLLQMYSRSKKCPQTTVFLFINLGFFLEHVCCILDLTNYHGLRLWQVKYLQGVSGLMTGIPLLSVSMDKQLAWKSKPKWFDVMFSCVYTIKIIVGYDYLISQVSFGIWNNQSPRKNILDPLLVVGVSTILPVIFIGSHGRCRHIALLITRVSTLGYQLPDISE